MRNEKTNIPLSSNWYENDWISAILIEKKLHFFFQMIINFVIDKHIITRRLKLHWRHMKFKFFVFFVFSLVLKLIKIGFHFFFFFCLLLVNGDFRILLLFFCSMQIYRKIFVFKFIWFFFISFSYCACLVNG